MNSTGQTQAGRDLVRYTKASTRMQTVSNGGTKASQTAIQFSYLEEQYIYYRYKPTYI